MIKNYSFIIFFHELCVLIQTTNSRLTCFFLSSQTLKVGQEQILDIDYRLLELNRFVTLYISMQNWFLISRNLCQGFCYRQLNLRRFKKAKINKNKTWNLMLLTILKSVDTTNIDKKKVYSLKHDTDKSLSEALILAATNPQYDKRLFIDLTVQYMKTTSSEHEQNMLCA